MNRVKTPQSFCRAGVGRCDITPPIGTYHRMWGAAMHDKSTGIHRPLEATLLWLEPELPATGLPQIIIALDHCILDTDEMRNIRESIAAATDVPSANIQVALSHTHGSGWMSRSRSHLPGGEEIGPYLDYLAIRLTQLANETRPKVESASIVYGVGRCDLARHRDFLDSELGSFACGFNPDGPADDTLLVGRVANHAGNTIATLVNYACHPTTLAWGNTLISPDWIGAMREVIESNEGGYCVFLQGASGDLGPREGFVADPAVADRNGRQVGFAALSALATLPQSGTEFVYSGPMVSGATIGTWSHQPVSQNDRNDMHTWQWEHLTVQLPYRYDLPSIEQTTAEREHWLTKEAEAKALGDEEQIRLCRAQIEQRTRQLARLNSLVPGSTFPLSLHIGITGDTIWIFVPGELYQLFQTTLRERFAPRPIIVATLTNDWQPGYIPPANTYGYGIYQEIIAATAPGCMELLIESLSRKIKSMVAH